MRRQYEHLAGGLLHRAQWMELGIHSRELASSSFTTVFPGFHTLTEHPASLNAMAWTLQHRVVPGGVLSHSTAAVLWGIPIPIQLDGGVGLLRATGRASQRVAPCIPSVRPDASLRDGAELPILHCRVPHSGTSGVGTGVVVHRWRPGPSVELDGLRLSTPFEVLRELASALPLRDLVAAVDGTVGPEAPNRPGPIVWPDLDGTGQPGPVRDGMPFRRATVDGLRSFLDESVSRRAIPHLRRATGLSRPEVRSPGETYCRLLITAVGLPEPTPNLRVTDPRTGRYRVLDLAWEDLGLALEYDGDVHRTKELWREDEARRDELASLGWTLARANGDDVRRPRRMLLRLARTLAERGVQVPSVQEITRSVAVLASQRLTRQTIRPG